MISWSLALEFIIPGQPIPKARPRFARTRAGVRTYSTGRTAAFESKVALFAASGHRWKGYLAPAGVPVRVDIVAVFERPQRLTRKSDPDTLLPHAKRPDIDNVQKAILDGLSKAAARIYVDDAQVQVTRVEKFYTERGGHPRTMVRIYIPTEDRAGDEVQKMDARAARADTEGRKRTQSPR